MHLWPDRRPAGSGGLEQLLHELAEEQGERAEVATRAQEEAHERLALADPLRLVLDGGGRQVGAGGITGDEVADARAVVREQALAVRDPADDLTGIDRVARDHEVLTVALVPPEGRDPVVVAMEDAGLAAVVIDGGRLPARQLVAAVADPVGHRVDRPARIRPARIGWASPSIWTMTRPG